MKYPATPLLKGLAWALASSLLAWLALGLQAKSAQEETKRRDSQAIRGWALGTSQALKLRDDFILEALSRSCLASGWTAYEVLDPEGRVVFPPEASSEPLRDPARIALQARNLIRLDEDHHGIQGQSHYLPLTDGPTVLGVLRIHGPIYRESPWVLSGTPLVCVGLVFILVFWLYALDRAPRPKPIIPSKPIVEASPWASQLLERLMQDRSQAMMLVANNRVLATWGPVARHLDKEPIPGTHIAQWSELAGDPRLLSLLENKPWPDKETSLSRFPSGELCLFAWQKGQKNATESLENPN